MKHSPPSNAILVAWEQTLKRNASAAAIRGPGGEVRRTFAEIETEATSLEPLFEPFSTRSAIGVQIGNSECWPAMLLALFRRQLVPLPLGCHVEGHELSDGLAACGAAAIAVIDKGRIVVHPRPGTATRHTSEFLKLTSGTTNAPRAVRFQAVQLLADCDNICETMGITDRDLNFGVIPFSHSYGFSNLITPLLCRGVPLVASEDRVPRAILNDLQRSGATVFPGMPVFFDKLAALKDSSQLPRLRLCISAGAPLPRCVAEAFSLRFEKKIHTFYGSSECGGIGFDRSERQVYEDGFAGQPLCGVEITPEPGEGAQKISVLSAAVGDGYFPIEEQRTLGEGRFVPGDLVRWTERGMFIVGRASDVINIAGRKLNPCEIEGRLAEFPGIRQVVVFGVPSVLRGEEPVACIAGEGIDRSALQCFCQSQLSQWQIPRDFWIVKELPENERGKISRRALAKQYASETKPI